MSFSRPTHSRNENQSGCSRLLPLATIGRLYLWVLAKGASIHIEIIWQKIQILDSLISYSNVGDKELIAADAVASGRGRAIEIAWMKGRSRSFESVDATRARLLSIAFHDRCDLMVAVATFAPGNQDAVEPVVIAFLNSDRVLRWVKWLTL